MREAAERKDFGYMERANANDKDEVVQKLEAAVAAGNITPEQFEEYKQAYLRSLGKVAIEQPEKPV